MAEQIWYVDPDATGAADGTSWADAYTTLNAAFGAKAADLVTATNNLVFECRSSAGTADTAEINTGSSWVTSAAYDVEVRTSGANRPDFAGIDTSAYRLVGTGGANLMNIDNIDHIKWDGIQFAPTAGRAYYASFGISAGVHELTHCVFKGHSANYVDLVSLGKNQSGCIAKVGNCFFYDHTGTESTAIVNANANSTTYCHANTFRNITRGVETSAGTMHCRSCLFDSVTDAVVGTLTGSVDYCVSTSTEPSVAQGSNNTPSATFSLVDAANGDLHLSGDGGDAGGAGEDLDADANLAITDDIDGDSRHATTPDCGADELVASVSTSRPAFITISNEYETFF